MKQEIVIWRAKGLHDKKTGALLLHLKQEFKYHKGIEFTTTSNSGYGQQDSGYTVLAAFATKKFWDNSVGVQRGIAYAAGYFIARYEIKEKLGLL